MMAARFAFVCSGDKRSGAIATVAGDDSAVALEAIKGVDGDSVFLVESVLEFVAGAQKSRA
jgi:hypothetical protein